MASSLVKRGAIRSERSPRLREFQKSGHRRESLHRVGLVYRPKVLVERAYPEDPLSERSRRLPRQALTHVAFIGRSPEGCHAIPCLHIVRLPSRRAVAQRLRHSSIHSLGVPILRGTFSEAWVPIQSPNCCSAPCAKAGSSAPGQSSTSCQPVSITVSSTASASDTLR